jgi:hypothetical protein
MSMFRDLPDLASQLLLQTELVLIGTNLAEGRGDRQREGDSRIAD